MRLRQAIGALIHRVVLLGEDLVSRVHGCRVEPPLPLVPLWVRRGALAGFFVTVLVLVAVFAVYLNPPTPDQPIPFSHKFHVQTKGLQCLFCHNSAPRSSAAGIPSVDKCLLCHNVIAPKFAPIARLHTYNNKGEAVPWQRVNKVPDFVRFSHQAHLTRRVDCGECHGNVAQMDRVEVVNEFDMNFCVTCHWRKKVSDSCANCHY